MTVAREAMNLRLTGKVNLFEHLTPNRDFVINMATRAAHTKPTAA